ncbi:MAG: hypothetical protein DRH07_06275 [Deltaproteobacteria bacterium]|nr:MAG: hypothetical protein DRH07_06275 [Deltaproteobacteria bacterium]
MSNTIPESLHKHSFNCLLSLNLFYFTAGATDMIILVKKAEFNHLHRGDFVDLQHYMGFDQYLMCKTAFISYTFKEH